ncbi:related to YPD1 - two-component phosphorelay intermediate [Ustilago sp. UG-2017b]|nr:related to YPD1 - two-component phosphorelay intermediate [Ustilago sp. UG-2017b]
MSVPDIAKPSTDAVTMNPAADVAPNLPILPVPEPPAQPARAPILTPTYSNTTTTTATTNTATTSNDKQGADGAPGSAGDLSPSIIDMDIFTQLLEMDDEDDREFSKSIVWNYFDQAETTFKEMDAALSTHDLTELSTLGHFLKGSSAAVGVIKVRDSCEHMQHYGKCHGEDGVSDLSKEGALKKLTVTLRDVKVQYREAAKALKAFYDEGEQEEEEADGEGEGEAENEQVAGKEETQAEQKVEEQKETAPAPAATSANPTTPTSATA